MSFRDKYQVIAEQLLQRPLLSEDGIAPSEIDMGLEATGESIPIALRDYYSVLGANAINTAHNRLLKPNELRFDFEESALVFMDENQSVCSWGILIGDLGLADPTAHQGQPDDGDWYSEECTVAEFLVISIYLQCCWGGLKFTGSAMDAEQVLSQVRGEWNESVNHNGLVIWERDGALISHMGQPWASGAANTAESFAILENMGFTKD